MKISVAGTFHGIDEGVSVGQVVDVDDDSAIRYIHLGYAERVGEEYAVSHTDNEERAVIEPVIGNPVEPPTKRGPGRPRKVTT